MDDPQQLDQEEIVTMSIPEEALNPASAITMAKQELQQLSNQSTESVVLGTEHGTALPPQQTPPQQGTVVNQIAQGVAPITQSPPQTAVKSGNEGTIGQLVSEGEKPNDRNVKGQFVKGNRASVGNKGGSPCEYCKDKERLQKIADDYIVWCRKGSEGKVPTPFIEELGLRMGFLSETLTEWSTRKLKNGELEHPEFAVTLKTVREMQRYRLQQRTLGRYNPTGAIFLLKANHGLMETEKRLLAGDKDSEPIRVEIVEEENRLKNE